MLRNRVILFTSHYTQQAHRNDVEYRIPLRSFELWSWDKWLKMAPNKKRQCVWREITLRFDAYARQYPLQDQNDTKKADMISDSLCSLWSVEIMQTYILGSMLLPYLCVFSSLVPEYPHLHNEALTPLNHFDGTCGLL